jgi:hypothetical protein
LALLASPFTRHYKALRKTSGIDMAERIQPNPLRKQTIPGIEASAPELLLVLGLLIEPEQRLRKHF